MEKAKTVISEYKQSNYFNSSRTTSRGDPNSVKVGARCQGNRISKLQCCSSLIQQVKQKRNDTQWKMHTYIRWYQRHVRFLFNRGISSWNIHWIKNHETRTSLNSQIFHEGSNPDIIFFGCIPVNKNRDSIHKKYSSVSSHIASQYDYHHKA